MLVGHDALDKAAESETLKKMGEGPHEPQGDLSSFGKTFARELKEEIDKGREEAKKLK